MVSALIVWIILGLHVKVVHLKRNVIAAKKAIFQ